MKNKEKNIEEPNKTTASKHKLKKIIASLCALSLFATAGYSINKIKKVDELLSLNGIQADSDTIDALKDKYGDISGRWVEVYAKFFSDYGSDVKNIAGIYVSEDGESLNNTLSGSDLKITTSDGKVINVDNFQGNDAIYSDADEVIETISYKELRDNYELCFGITDVKLEGSNEDSEVRVYDPYYGAKLVLKK